MKQITIYDLLPLLKNGYVAMDRDGTWKWFSHKPHKVGEFVWGEVTYWECYHHNCEGSFLTRAFDIAPFDGDWKDSLIKVEHKEEYND